MILNHSQVIALYSLCVELGFGSHMTFEMVSQEEASLNVLVDVGNTLTASTARFRLDARGGKELVGTRDT